MPHFKIYVSDEIEQKILDAAMKEGKSISNFIADLVCAKFSEDRNQNDYFSQFFGTWEGDFPNVKRGDPQGREKL